MTYFCDLCGKEGVYRYTQGFQMIACKLCAIKLRLGTNWVLVSQPAARENLLPVIADWRARHGTS